MYKNAALAAVLLYPFLSLAEKDIFIAAMSGNYGGDYIHKIKFYFIIERRRCNER